MDSTDSEYWIAPTFLNEKGIYTRWPLIEEGLKEKGLLGPFENEADALLAAKALEFELSTDIDEIN